MAGLNQTRMLSLSMVVIAALIGAGGLGLTVYTGLGRLDVGTAGEGGLGIVLIAIILDRITQALGEQRTARASLLETFRSLFRYRLQAPEPAAGPGPRASCNSTFSPGETLGQPIPSDRRLS